MNANKRKWLQQVGNFGRHCFRGPPVAKAFRADGGALVTSYDSFVEPVSLTRYLTGIIQ